MIEENLKRLGFTKNEVKTYLALVRLGKAKAGELIKETGLQRSVVYSCLEVLTDKGVAGASITNGVAVYAPNNPEALIYEAEQRAFIARKTSEELKELQQIKEREVTVYEGEGLIKRVADKYLASEPGSTIYFLGPSKFGIQSNLEKYWQYYHKKRVEKGIKCKILYDKTTDSEIIKNRNTLPLCEARYLPLEAETPMSFIMNREMVSILIPSEDPPLAFLVKSRKTAETLKKYFDFLWSKSREDE